MNISSFARILNAEPLLLTPDKRVLHFPATNKVRIDNIGSNVPEYRQADLRSNRKEYANANAASKLGVVPPVQNYRERGNMISYTQDYAGQPLPNKLKGIAPKEQYKLGSQVGRMQNRLREQNLGHVDIHEGNIVRSKPNGREVRLIDNAAIENINNKYDEGEMKNLYARKRLGKPFMTGYNSRINFTQHKQMQHFANFGIPAGVNKFLGNNLDVAFPAAMGTGIGANIGGLVGLAKGAGIGESEEERANTTAGGRVGKIFGKTLGGAAIGGVTGGTLGAGVGAGGRYLRGRKSAVTSVGQAPTSIPID